MKINETTPVMLTGATGYVGGHIAKLLLEKGHHVHAPIRNPKDKEKTKYLDAIAEESQGRISYFEADLLESGSYEKAMKNCELVIHTASPFITNPKDAQKDLVDPALIGTINVLETAKATKSVRRVVLTSSCVAIYGEAKDTLNYPNHTMTEEHWNTTSSLVKSPYNYSKVLAEKKAWELAKSQDQFDLVTVNPSLVLGPGINPKGTSESYNIVKQLGDGSLKTGAPELNIGCVDVRDVAKAHYLAGYTQEAKGRYICSAENLSLLELADYLRPKYGETYALPTKLAPKWLLWLIGPMFGVSRQFVKDNVGYPWKADNTKIKQELKMKFRPISDAINEFFEQIEETGAFKK